MKVCVLTTAFPRWPGDGEAPFVWEAVRAVKRRGVEARVIAMHSPGALTREWMEGVEIIRPRYWWPERWEMLRREGAAGLPAALRKRPYAFVQLLPLVLRHAQAAARLCRDCDLIHAHWTLSAGAALLAQRTHRRPVLVTMHGSDVLDVGKRPGGAWLTRRILLRCDGITAVSSALAAAAAAMGVPAARIRVISNGVDTERFTPLVGKGRDGIVLYAGSLIERKGVRHLLAAAPAVLRRFPSYRLVILGEGPQHGILRDLAAALGVLDSTTFAGRQSQDQVREWMQRARAVVVPSLEEAQGVVLLEALACGTPVVASGVDGIPEVIVPAVGRLVPPGEPMALSEAIVRILADSSEWAAMSKRARERAVTHYDWDRVAGLYVSEYESVAQVGQL